MEDKRFLRAFLHRNGSSVCIREEKECCSGLKGGSAHKNEASPTEENWNGAL